MVEILFSIAAIFISLSYLATEILTLRFISLVGGFLYLIGGLIAGFDSPGMKALIFFSAVNIVINIAQSIKIILDRKPLLLPQKLQLIYNQTFSSLTPNEFMKIYKASHHKVVHKKIHLITQNHHVSHLMLIMNGVVNIIRNHKIVTQLSSGYFLGEMSYLREGVSTATVEVVSDHVEYIYWDNKYLGKLRKKQPELYGKFKRVISLDLIRKIEKHMDSV